ncbi:Holliday junction resolvase RuvX [Coriobacteriia bacterium Es71-Z0120]|uniref:Holliday junction resolvase RuvX n=1 Tax=Parvivirga hydrogeniphila TaxID=2939460 RepID=UPI0022609A6B|nr:Holliday junction resolvase RuvX [Parvivirga hydrogeniphila]MCL4079169.1 Holliday junction resolvase RuvX [Parvivirga hydrogeniphila]
MRVLGLDIGSVRVGVAISDPSGTVATPRCVLDAKQLLRDPRELKAIVEEEGVELLVVGLPVTMAGEEGPQARSARVAGEALKEVLGLPVEYFDERLTTVAASSAMRSGGVRGRSQRGRLDAAAAAIMLQAYLDRRKARRSDGS